MQIYLILLACSDEKVLDSYRRNLLQLCLLLGGDRVQEKIHMGITAAAVIPNQQQI